MLASPSPRGRVVCAVRAIRGAGTTVQRCHQQTALWTPRSATGPRGRLRSERRPAVSTSFAAAPSRKRNACAPISFRYEACETSATRGCYLRQREAICDIAAQPARTSCSARHARRECVGRKRAALLHEVFEEPVHKSVIVTLPRSRRSRDRFCCGAKPLIPAPGKHDTRAELARSTRRSRRNATARRSAPRSPVARRAELRAAWPRGQQARSPPTPRPSWRRRTCTRLHAEVAICEKRGEDLLLASELGGATPTRTTPHRALATARKAKQAAAAALIRKTRLISSVSFAIGAPRRARCRPRRVRRHDPCSAISGTPREQIEQLDAARSSPTWSGSRTPRPRHRADLRRRGVRAGDVGRRGHRDRTRRAYVQTGADVDLHRRVQAQGCDLHQRRSDLSARRRSRRQRCLRERQVQPGQRELRGREAALLRLHVARSPFEST